MTEVYDLNKTGGYFSPLPLTPEHQRSLRAAVFQGIRAIPGVSRDVLSAYSPHPVEWEIPPLYCGRLNGVSLQVAPPVINCPGSQSVIETFKGLIETYQRTGWGGPLSGLLSRRIGPMADHPLMFTKEGGSVERFAIELVVAMSGAYPRNLIESDNSLALCVPEKRDLQYIGIVEDKVLNTSVVLQKAELLTTLLSPRGTVIPKSYGTYDRLLLWLDQNYGNVEEADKLRYALSLLKLSSDLDKPFDRDEVMFERAIRNMKDSALPKEKMEASLTYERFTEIRSIWMLAEEDKQEGAFFNLLNALVPDVLDSMMFQKMFGSIPEIGKQLTKRQLKNIDSGIEKFTAFYTRMERGAK